MPDPTSNHAYNRPAKGTDDWHRPLNENFTKIEVDVEVRDVDANRGDYEPTSGAKFLATDTGTVYIGDGSQWSELGTISAGGGGGGSTVLASGTVSATGGATPAFDGKLGTALDQAASFGVALRPQSPDFSGDFAFNYDWGRHWSGGDGGMDVHLTVNWDTDPGSGNDLPIDWKVVQR